MASAGGGAIRNKRGHSVSKPYERKKSLFRRLTDSFRDAFRPSWFQIRLSKDGAGCTDDHKQAAGSSDDNEDVFVSHVQSPSQLSGQPPFSSKSMPALSGSEQEQETVPALGQNMASASSFISTATSFQQSLHESVQGSAQNSLTPLVQRDSTTRMLPALHQERVSSSLSMGLRGSVSETRNINKAPASLLLAATPMHKNLTSDSKTNQSYLVTPTQHQVKSRPFEDDRNFLGCLLEERSPEISSPLGLSSPCQEENAAKRRRLWCPEGSRRGCSLQPALNETPSFKVSVFCSPSMNDSVHESSFYSGKTTFGGASSYKRNLNSSVYQRSLPIRKAVQPKPLNRSENAVLSSSATQILKTLERLSNAKKTGSSAIGSDSLLSFTPSTYRKGSSSKAATFPSRSLELPNRGPPTHKMQLFTTATVARNHQVSTLRSSQPKRTCQSSISGGEEGQLDSDIQLLEASGSTETVERNADVFFSLSSDSGARKMKRPKTYEMHQRVQKDDESAEVPRLRTDFTLPVSAMPSFDFSLPSSTTAACSTSTLETAATSSSFRKIDVTNPPLQFTFSSPIQKSEPGASPAGATPERFQFSIPLKVAQSLSPSVDKSPASNQLSSSSSSVTSASTLTSGSSSAAPKAKSVSLDAMPKMASASSGFDVASSSGLGSIKPATQLKQGSVMDILGASGISNNSMDLSTGFGVPFKPAAQLFPGSVMDVLGGKSEASAAASPSLSIGAQPASKETMTDAQKKVLVAKPEGDEDLMAKFRRPVGTWECESCMLQNKPEAVKCVACETPKAGSSSTTAGSKSTKSSSGPAGTTDSLFAKFAPSPGTWDCNECMLQNKAEVTKCAACETPKPGTALGAPSAHTDLWAKFCKPADSWECDICMVLNNGSRSKCVACKSSRPGTLSLGSKIGSSQQTSSGVVAAIGPSGGITFNLGTSAASSSSPFLTKASTSKDSVSAGFAFTPSSTSSTHRPESGFTASASDTSNTCKPEAGFTFSASNTSSTDKPEAGFTFSASNTSSTDKPEAGFTFSASGAAGQSDSSVCSAGFKFGHADFANSATLSGFSCGGFPPSTSVQASNGTQQPATSSFAFGVINSSSPSMPSGLSAASFLASPTLSGSKGGSQGLSLVSATAAQGSATSDKTNSSDSAKKEGSVPAAPTASFPLLFGQPSSSLSAGAGLPSAAAGSGVSASGGFHFSVPPKTNQVNAPLFGAKTATQGPDHTLPHGNGFFSQSKASTMASGFGLQVPVSTSTDATSPSSQCFSPSSGGGGGKVLPSGALSSLASSGFALGSSATSTTTASVFSFGLPSGSSGLPGGMTAQPAPKIDFPGIKPTVNGEASGTSEGFKFGQPVNSIPTFNFGRPSSTVENPVTQNNPILGLGFNATSKAEPCKRGLDVEDGPLSKKKGLDCATVSSGAAEPFKASPVNPTASGTSSLFKFGQSSEEKPASVPSFGSSGFQFNPVAQTGGFSFATGLGNVGNAAGGTGSVFGAGLGSAALGSSSTTPNQFSFGAGGNLQNSAAAASSFSGETPGNTFPARGFAFNPATNPTFSFGTSNSSVPVFQFAGAESATPPSQPPGGVFVFGQSNQVEDGQASSGSGNSQRMYKKALRRTRK